MKPSPVPPASIASPGWCASTGTASRFGRAFGLAHRAFAVPNTVDTRFGLASGAKGFTALMVVSL